MSSTNKGWISTKDKLPEPERAVLAFFVNSYGKSRRIRAFHTPEYTTEATSEDDCSDYCEEKDEYYLPEGWYEENEYEDTHWSVSDEVLYWMPLPDPPDIKET